MDLVPMPSKRRRPVFADPVTRLKALQTRMAAEAALTVVVMNTQGVLPSVDDSIG